MNILVFFKQNKALWEKRLLLLVKQGRTKERLELAAEFKARLREVEPNLAPDVVAVEETDLEDEVSADGETMIEAAEQYVRQGNDPFSVDEEFAENQDVIDEIFDNMEIDTGAGTDVFAGRYSFLATGLGNLQNTRRQVCSSCHP